MSTGMGPETPPPEGALAEAEPGGRGHAIMVGPHPHNIRAPPPPLARGGARQPPGNGAAMDASGAPLVATSVSWNIVHPFVSS